MRPARKAREGRIPGVCNRRATPRPGMQRRPNVTGLRGRDAAGGRACNGSFSVSGYLCLCWSRAAASSSRRAPPRHHYRVSSLDSVGGVIPGATVVVEGAIATGTTFDACHQQPKARSTFRALTAGATRSPITAAAASRRRCSQTCGCMPGRTDRRSKRALEVGQLWRKRSRSPKRPASLVNTRRATIPLHAQRRSDQQRCRLPIAQRAQRRDVPAGRQHGDAPTASRASTACRSRSSASRSTA